MLNLHLSYKPPSYWGVLFRSVGRPRHFSRLKIFRDLVVPGGEFRKGIVIQVIMTPTGVLTNGNSFLIIKGGATLVSVHAPRQRNSLYRQTCRRSIYKTILPERPH